jgi:hypothetical protein
MHHFLLAVWNLSVTVTPKFLFGERLRMVTMSVQGQHHGCTLLHDSHSRMTAAVDAPLVPLGQAKPAFQIQVVAWPSAAISTSEKARLERLASCIDKGRKLVVETQKQVTRCGAGSGMRCANSGPLAPHNKPAHSRCKHAGDDASLRTCAHRTQSTTVPRVLKRSRSTPHPSATGAPYFCLRAKATGGTTLPWPPSYTNRNPLIEAGG